MERKNLFSNSFVTLFCEMAIALSFSPKAALCFSPTPEMTPAPMNLTRYCKELSADQERLGVLSIGLPEAFSVSGEKDPVFDVLATSEDGNRDVYVMCYETENPELTGFEDALQDAAEDEVICGVLAAIGLEEEMIIKHIRSDFVEVNGRKYLLQQYENAEGEGEPVYEMVAAVPGWLVSVSMVDWSGKWDELNDAQLKAMAASIEVTE